MERLVLGTLLFFASAGLFFPALASAAPCPSQDRSILQRFDTNHNNVIDDQEVTAANIAWTSGSPGVPNDAQISAIVSAWTSGCLIGGALPTTTTNPPGGGVTGSNPPTTQQSLPDDYLRYLSGQIAVVGGLDANRDVEFYDLKSDSVSQQPSLNTGRVNAAAAAFQNRIYVFGGSTSFINGKNLSSVESFSPGEGSWRIMKPMKVAVTNASAIAFGKKIYVFGGKRGQRGTSILQIFDPIKNYWSLGRPMPHPREVSCAQTLGVIYCFGKNVDRAYVDIYNPEKGKWSSRIVENRISLMSVASNGIAFISGITTDDKIFSYNTLSDTWDFRSNAPFGLTEAGQTSAVTVSIGGFPAFVTSTKRIYIDSKVVPLVLPRTFFTATAAYLPPRPSHETGAVVAGRVVTSTHGRPGGIYKGGVLVELSKLDYDFHEVRVVDTAMYNGTFKFTGLPIGSYTIYVAPYNDRYTVNAIDQSGRKLSPRDDGRIPTFQLSDTDKLSITITLSPLR